MNFFKQDVKSPAMIRIIPCPSENRNNIKTEYVIFLETVARAIMLAKIGVEQGVPASANTAPTKNGKIIWFLELLWGSSFTITGILNSNIPTIFRPIIRIIDAIIE